MTSIPKRLVIIIMQPEIAMQTSSILIAVVRDLSVFGVWGWLDLIGAIFVALGCAGEFVVLLNKIPEHNERRLNLKGIWGIINDIDSGIRLTLARLKIVRRRKWSDLKEH